MTTVTCEKLSSFFSTDIRNPVEYFSSATLTRKYGGTRKSS